jgi:hypothetical protein
MTLDRLDTAIAFVVIMLGVSLLITIATQILSALLGLRGTNLLWGLKTVLKDCGITTKADEIAREILSDPRISDSVFSGLKDKKLLDLITRRWRLATAIRPDELSRVLNGIADRYARNKEQMIADSITRALSMRDAVAEKRLDELQKVVGAGWASAASSVIERVTGSARDSILQLETAFATVMDRVGQRFAMTTRLWSVLFAVLIAFGLHLDSIALLERFAANPDQRAAVLGARAAILEEAQRAHPGTAPPATATQPALDSNAPPMVSPAILKSAMESLKKAEPKSRLPQVPDFAGYSEAITWLGSHNQGALESRFQREVILALEARATEINNLLTQSGFSLIPKPWKLRPLFDSRRNLLGILITSALLSLGSPFWFNTLKQLSNLRTVLAENEKAEAAKA